MAKFALECPKCGAINTASTFLLAKKVIKCGSCGEEINVAQSRMTSKQCSECGKIVVCDQAKMKNMKCPSCGNAMGLQNATTEYKMKEIICPQCSCQIEVDKTKERAVCPVCDKAIDIKKELAKAELVNGAGISVIKYEGANNTFIWKHPIEDFNLGSQLIVHESQEAIFFLNGEALDTFGPGRHVLETENLPILKKVVPLPTEKQNPFHAEVYFINKTVQMGIKWGTDSRVRFIEPNTGIPLDIGASGEMNLQVSNGRKLLVKLVGTTGGLTRDQIIQASAGSTALVNEGADKNIDGTSGYENARNISADKSNNAWSNTLRGFFRPMIMSVVKSNLASTIKTQKINILEIDEQLESLSGALREKICEGFEEYGLTVPQFYVTNVSLPEDDKNFKKMRDLIASSYLGVREAEVKAGIVAAEGSVIYEQEKIRTEQARYEAERARIEAQAEADKKRYEGFAEAEVMAAKGYNQKDVLQAEVQKAYAEGIGNMGGEGSGGGGMMSDILGLGIGMAAAGTMGSQMNEVMKGFSGTQQQPASEAENGWDCPCGKKNNTGKFCSECGNAKPETWDCTACGNKGNTGKFCSECGSAKPEAWDCPNCGAKGNKGKFCSECGKEKGVSDTWDCACGNKGITGKFCSECGAKKEDNE